MLPEQPVQVVGLVEQVSHELEQPSRESIQWSRGGRLLAQVVEDEAYDPLGQVV